MNITREATCIKLLIVIIIIVIQMYSMLNFIFYNYVFTFQIILYKEVLKLLIMVCRLRLMIIFSLSDKRVKHD